ncbi:MAG: peptidylprolyl isomerase, partial [Burkholderiaceae bacterium]
MRELDAWRQQVATGQADFAALAQAHSQDGSAAQGGDLGWAEPGQFVPEFEQAMNALPVGGVSQPVVSRFGVHLIQVVQRRQEPMTEAQQRDWARQQLRVQRAPMA